MRAPRMELVVAGLLAALTGGLAALVPVEQPVRIAHVGYDVAADVFVIQGEHFVDERHALPPYVEIGGVPAEVVSSSAQFLTARAPGLGPGEYRVHVSRRNITTRQGRVLGAASQDAFVRLADVVAGAVAEPAPRRVAVREPAR